MTPEQISRWNRELRDRSPLEITRWAVAHAPGRTVVSTNFRPYEAVILHLATQALPRIPVLWVDHGYNRPATYLHAETPPHARPRSARVSAGSPSRTATPSTVPVPDTDDETALKQFSAQMKLEPFQRGMKELAPLVWLTALRKSQNPNRAGLDIVSLDENFGTLKVSPLFPRDRRRPGRVPAGTSLAERVGLLRSRQGRRETRVRTARGLGRRGRAKLRVFLL